MASGLVQSISENLYNRVLETASHALDLFNLITENMIDLIAIIETSGSIQYASTSFKTSLGYEPGDLLQKSVFELIHTTDIAACRKFRRRMIYDRKPGQIELRFRHVKGRYVSFEVTCRPIVDENNRIRQFVLSARDITERKKAEALIHQMAYYDRLTGMPNRSSFKLDLDKVLQSARKQAANPVVMCIDLDGFKRINDTLGHSIGDLLLSGVAERIQAYLQPGEKVYRTGGDELTILIPHARNFMCALKSAERIMNVFRQPWKVQGQSLRITASMGIAIAPVHGSDGETLMKNADIAMFEAKDRGKNAYQVFDDHLQEKMAQRLAMEDALHLAMEQYEFVLYYQPVVDVQTLEVVGAEALIRWKRPGHRMVSPAEFIPVAEETGLIVPMGEWILESACYQAKYWNEERKKSIRIHVNLSSRQFQEPFFLDKLKNILAETRVSPEWIGLEITESLIMTDVHYATQTLKELRSMGIMISIDDFGTGYSSLGYLKALPVDKLKIDQTFVRDLENNSEDEAIINTIITLAKNLGLTVVAEGVETTSHLQTLKGKDCDEVQGYFFSKPIPAQDFEERYF